MSEHISSNTKSGKQAQVILRILVKLAMDPQKPTITYGELARQIDTFHLALRYPLGRIGEAIFELGEEWEEDIPEIQGLVVNQDTRLPGDSVNFLYNRQLSNEEKKKKVKKVHKKIFEYPKWLDVLEAFGLSNKSI